jgi:hypothetical protein
MLLQALVAAFFDAEGLQRMVTYLCNVRMPGSQDPITSTVLDLLTGRLQFCLTETGLVPFKGKAGVVYPYHMMTQAQKAFLRESLSTRHLYCVCNEAVVFYHSPGDVERLGAVEVLEALCSRILASKVHSDHRVRIGVCNIILQRVQSVVPLSKNVQQRLNSTLFGAGSGEDLGQ